jgi:hypothetical protein
MQIKFFKTKTKKGNMLGAEGRERTGESREKKGNR